MCADNGIANARHNAAASRNPLTPRQRVAVWTVDDPATARELEAMGVDYVITNRPGEL